MTVLPPGYVTDEGYYNPYSQEDSKVEILDHDFALAMALLDESHEDLSLLAERSEYKVVQDALAMLRTARYLLTGE